MDGEIQILDVEKSLCRKRVEPNLTLLRTLLWHAFVYEHRKKRVFLNFLRAFYSVLAFRSARLSNPW